MNTVLIVEDDPQTRRSLHNTVDAHPKLQVVDTASNLAEGREKFERYQPQILLTDLGLPDGNGSELIGEITKQYPQTLALVLSMFGDEQNVIAAIMAGAKGYILKKADGNSISESILQMLDGASPISPAIARYLLTNLRKQAPTISEGDAATHKLLTKREVQVLEQVAQGYRSNEIADKLCISYHTVVHHIRSVYEKLAVNSRSEAVFKASKLGLIQT